MKCFSYIQMNRINLLGSPLLLPLCSASDSAHYKPFLCCAPSFSALLSTFFNSLTIPHFSFPQSLLFESFLVLPHSTTRSLYFLDTPDTVYTSWKMSSPLELYFPSLLGICLYFSLNSEHHSFFFTFHHLIFPSVFTHFLFMISKVILQSRIWCCLAAFSPDTTLQSLVS